VIVAMATVAISNGLITFLTVAIAADSPPVESAQIDPAATPFLMRSGVVVDPVAGRLYMMNPQGGIDAVEIASGKLLWTTKAAAKPLAAFDDRLIAQAETGAPGSVPIVFIDTAHEGRPDSTLALPARHGPGIGEGLGSSSKIDARLISDGLLVWWSTTQSSISGVPGFSRTAEDGEGALVSLRTRHVTALTPEQAASKLRAERSSIDPSQLKGTGGLFSLPQLAEGYFVALKLGPATEGQLAALKRWDAHTGAPLADIELGFGYASFAISADESSFLFVKGAGSSTGIQEYSWEIYTIANGARMAQLELPVSASPFCVQRSVLVLQSDPYNRRVNGQWVQEPLAIRALDIKTGNEIWKRLLRDTSYHGPYPPHPQPPPSLMRRNES
jgi:hypothetical protein